MYKVLDGELPVKKKKAFNITLPKNFSGKFGLGFSIGRKEIFIGIAVNDIEVETIIRKKKVPTRKGRAFAFPI